MSRNRLLCLFAFVSCGRTITEDGIRQLREATLEMLDHAYSGYIKHAYPKDELMPGSY